MRPDDYMADWQPQRWRMNAQQMQQPETPMPKMPPTQHTQPIGQGQQFGGFQPNGPYGGFMPPFAGYQGQQPQFGFNGPRPQQQGFGWNPQNGPNWLEMMGGWRR